MSRPANDNGYRDASGHFRKDTGIAGGNLCPFCKRKIKMGAIDEHKCERKIICISVDRAQLKRIDVLAAKAGMPRSRYLTTCALGSDITLEERELIALVRGMKK